MRKSAKVPRILRINKLDGFDVYVAFNNGEHRIIRFSRLFEKWNYKEDPFRSRLLEKQVFQKLELNAGTLCWPNLIQKTTLSNGMEFEISFDLDPVVLYQESEPDEEKNQQNPIGSLIKTARQQAGLTQEELAKRSGTTKNYISRIENNKSDIELGTLLKIIEIGLGKRMNIQIN
ncbi:MAG: hypothetical protein KIPDCIKN_01473 [Haliscomenobacter sp.]|nr:hypothetical protein [Haliscomenobacter sp.]